MNVGLNGFYIRDGVKPGFFQVPSKVSKGHSMVGVDFLRQPATHKGRCYSLFIDVVGNFMHVASDPNRSNTTY